jgi:hypothetical protein
MSDGRVARLKEPLGIIVGWVELLRRGRIRGDRVAFALDAIARNAQLQAELIDDIVLADGRSDPAAEAQAAPLVLKKAKRRFQPSSASSFRKLGR